MIDHVDAMAPEMLTSSRVAGLSSTAWRRIGIALLIVFALVLPFLVTKYQSFQLSMAMI